MTTVRLAAYTFFALVLAVLAMGFLHGVSDAGESAGERIEGVVLTPTGEPVQGAIVASGELTVVTGADGLFVLPRPAPADGDLLVRAAGHADWRQSMASVPPSPFEVRLAPQHIRALYLNPTVTNTREGFDRLVEIANTTEINAVVIDIKEEWVWYDTGVAFFRDAATVDPVLDLPALLAYFGEHDIYTIARLVVFKDSLVAEANPGLAIRDTVTGGPWRDMNGVAWVNPMARELWTPNIDLAVEAAELGFDEIQYDYIRFPTDGDLSTMDFGEEYSRAGRQAAIEGFLAESRKRLLPTGARQSADVFGFAMVVDDDVGIGQHFASLAGVLDYVSPMVYPSHYSDGQFGLPGHPNDFPYDVVDISLRAGIDRIDGQALVIRPWLQDFDRAGMTPYDAMDVREQIRAADEAGTSGWMLWDPQNLWRTDRLVPDQAQAAGPLTAWLPSSPGRGAVVRRSPRESGTPSTTIRRTGR